jgi:CRP-like cAMP-binding protein
MMFKSAYCSHNLEWLHNIKLFSDCSDRDLDAVMRFVTPLDVPAGRVLTRQGEVGRECFVVSDGATWIERNGHIGPPIQGEVAGELALIDHAPRTATVTTAFPTRVLVMSQREFASLCRSHIADISERIEAAACAHRRALTVFATTN